MNFPAMNEHSRHTTWLGFLATALVALSPLIAAQAQEFDERFSDWPINLKIDGQLLAASRLENCFDNRDRLSSVFEPGVVHVLYFGASVEDAVERYQLGFKHAEFVKVEQLCPALRLLPNRRTLRLRMGWICFPIV